MKHKSVDEMVGAVSDDLGFLSVWINQGNEKQVLEILRGRRRKLGLTQREVADKTGYKQPHISEMECGGHSPTLRFLRKYAQAIGLELQVTFEKIK